MIYNTSFNDNELKFLFDESYRVLNSGLLSFSIRNDNDIMYKRGTKVADYIYDINSFQIRFFTKDIKFFVNSNFKIRKIIEEYEESAALYFVFCYKK